MLNWENARAVCLGFDGDLVTVKNEKEMNFLTIEYDDAWIGLNDRLIEGQYVWSDGTTFNSSGFNNWANGEPNNQENEDCVETQGDEWREISCWVEKIYACERYKGELMLLWLKLYLTRKEAAISMKIVSSKIMLQLF